MVKKVKQEELKASEVKGYSNQVELQKNSDIATLQKENKALKKQIKVLEKEYNDFRTNAESNYLSKQVLSDREYLITTKFRGRLHNKKLIKELRKQLDRYIIGIELRGKKLSGYETAEYKVRYEYSSTCIAVFMTTLGRLESVQDIVDKWR